MKKKSTREIPDFSHHPSRPKGPGAAAAVPPGKSKISNVAPPRPKPQATSSKSGQRGK